MFSLYCEWVAQGANKPWIQQNSPRPLNFVAFKLCINLYTITHKVEIQLVCFFTYSHDMIVAVLFIG